MEILQKYKTAESLPGLEKVQAGENSIPMVVSKKNVVWYCAIFEMGFK